MKIIKKIIHLKSVEVCGPVTQGFGVIVARVTAVLLEYFVLDILHSKSTLSHFICYLLLQFILLYIKIASEEN